MTHDDFAVEPVPGLPEELPAGEELLWQGAPEWWRAAWTVFPLRLIGAWFLLLAAWRLLGALNGAVSVGEGLVSMLWLGIPAGATFAILGFVAWLIGRTTVYSITSRRVVIRAGVALPVTTNIPFNVIEGAALKTYLDGTGDIPLSLAKTQRIGFLALWPHVRPWRLSRPQPMLRAVADGDRVADLLTSALVAYDDRPVSSVSESGATARRRRRRVAAAG